MEKLLDEAELLCFSASNPRWIGKSQVGAEAGEPGFGLR